MATVYTTGAVSPGTYSPNAGTELAEGIETMTLSNFTLNLPASAVFVGAQVIVNYNDNSYGTTSLNVHIDAGSASATKSTTVIGGVHTATFGNSTDTWSFSPTGEQINSCTVTLVGSNGTPADLFLTISSATLQIWYEKRGFFFVI